MPYHDVFVSASFESLRYFLNVKNTDNGTITLVFNDRYRDRTKPGTKVTVNPNAANGYKVASITVSRYLDASTTVPCVRMKMARLARACGALALLKEAVLLTCRNLMSK